MAVDLTLRVVGELAAGQPAPLLVVHDGRAYDDEGGLTAWLAAGVEAGRWPPVRVALTDARPRDERYSANEAYAAELRDLAGAWLSTRTVGIGISLGALAMLHAQRRAPGLFGGLFLQSGSFFRPELDPQESGFAFWDRIVGFTDELLAAGPTAAPVRITMTCGADEENLANNRLAAKTLERQGHDVAFTEVAGGHDFPSWRAAFDPALAGMLAGLVTSPG